MKSAVQTKRQAMGAPIAIKIQTDGDGTFTYIPSTLRVRQGDEVYWTTEDQGPFAISFNDATPFEDAVTLSSHADEDGNNVTDTKSIAAGKVGHHHYSVAIALSPNNQPAENKVVLDSGCPDIVVSN